MKKKEDTFKFETPDGEYGIIIRENEEASSEDFKKFEATITKLKAPEDSDDYMVLMVSGKKGDEYTIEPYIMMRLIEELKDDFLIDESIEKEIINWEKNLK